jgi:hypothetical protein
MAKFLRLLVVLVLLPFAANAQFVPNQPISREGQSTRVCSPSTIVNPVAGYLEALDEATTQFRQPVGNRDFARSIELLTPLAQAGDICSMLYLAQVYVSSSQNTEGLSWFKKASETGSALAQYHYAAAMRNTNSGTCDLMRELLQMSANQGYIHSMISLAQSYDQDRFCNRVDIQQAKNWYLRAATLGSAVGQHNLGYLILTFGPKRDYPKAWAWISLAQLQPISNDRRVVYSPSDGDGFLSALSRRIGRNANQLGTSEARNICETTQACELIEPTRLANFLNGQ